MGGIVAEWLAFAMQLKRVLFIEELAEWNAMDYFEGHLGMDLRFGDSEEMMLRERTGGKGKRRLWRWARSARTRVRVGKGTVARGRWRKRKRVENIETRMVRNQSIARGKK